MKPDDELDAETRAILEEEMASAAERICDRVMKLCVRRAAEKLAAQVVAEAIANEQKH